jgi:hypothetical protein
MKISKKTFAVLFHEKQTQDSLQHYVISRVAEHWREDGHEALYLFGTSKFIPADLVLVHVDLSVVPETYLEFARRYPIVLNGQVRDIRKSTLSENILRRDTSYDGRVIVKSNLNYAGAPEQRLTSSPSLLQSFSFRLRTRYRIFRSLWFESPRDYLVYDHLRHVPRRYFGANDIIVEKFLPEMDGELFCVRCFHFLGDRTFAVRLKASCPIVNGSTYKSLEKIEPHPQIVALRKKLNFDYGKFDYVVVDGKAILLDANKTVGMTLAGGGIGNNPELIALRRFRAEGIYSYFR